MAENAGANGLSPPGAAGSSGMIAVLDSTGPRTVADDPGSGATPPGREANVDDASTAVDVAAVVTGLEDGGAGAADAPAPADAAQAAVAGAERAASRLSARWLGAIAVALVVLAGGTGVSGYLVLRAHRDAQAIARANAAAVEAAKGCVAATQPTDAAALPASQQKLSECSTRAFGAQIAWYGAVLAEAYQAVNVRVQVPDMQGAVERDNDDASIVVLLAFRTKVSQVGMAERENGYRLRVKMVPEDGQFKVAELDQVVK